MSRGRKSGQMWRDEQEHSSFPSKAETPTNDTALIEAIKKYDGGLSVMMPNGYGGYLDLCDLADLKSLVSRLEAAEKERDIAREGCKKALTCASLDSSVRAFIVQSLKGESNDGR